MMIEFQEFPKIARLNRDVVVTEKIDGTNATVYVDDDGGVHAGSRNRWITPEADNHGFAKWVAAHVGQLRTMGPGWHRGEWWGCGIQRGYGLTEKRFSLFNTSRWNTLTPPPACCHVVPVLASGNFRVVGGEMEDIMDRLRRDGSSAAPGFMQPEGVVMFHVAAGTYFKATLLKDEEPKGSAR